MLLSHPVSHDVTLKLSL